MSGPAGCIFGRMDAPTLEPKPTDFDLRGSRTPRRYDLVQVIGLEQSSGPATPSPARLYLKARDEDARRAIGQRRDPMAGELDTSGTRGLHAASTETPKDAGGSEDT